ncbi:MAG: rod shape-determining protein MreD [Treponema sp.]|nr:rod shape-determining protein MreD [Treponema sp.]
MIKSLLISTLFLFSATIIEASILSNISFLLVVPDLVLICCIYFSLLNGKLYGQISGFISGIFLDFITGVPFGLNCIFRTLMGYLFGLFSETIIISGLVIPMASVAIGTVSKKLLIFVISLLFPKLSLNIYSIISYKFLFEISANVLLAPLVFKFLSFFKAQLSIRDTKDMIDNG